MNTSLCKIRHNFKGTIAKLKIRANFCPEGFFWRSQEPVKETTGKSTRRRCEKGTLNIYETLFHSKQIQRVWTKRVAI